MVGNMAKDRTTEEPVVLWTPWGMERTWRPGERFAALRRLALRLRSVRKPIRAGQKPPLN
jgi:hypothetical protein